MNNYFDLLATDYQIDLAITLHLDQPGAVKVFVNDQVITDQVTQGTLSLTASVGLLTPVNLRVEHSGAYVSSLKFDGWETRPQWGQELPGMWQFTTHNQPFYLWQHQATGQGWLLTP